MNADTSGSQYDPDVAGLGGPSFVVVWTNGAGSPALQAQIFDADGKVGSELAISTGDYGYSASVSADSGGDFVVVWEDGCGECGRSVQGRRFSAAGSPLGTEFEVAAAGYHPDVAVAPGGDFVVVWADGGYVRAQRYDGMAGPVGTEFVVSAFSTYAYEPAVAITDDGGFVAAWSVSGSYPGGAEVFARLYDDGGASVGTEFMVNTYSTDDQSEPDVAMDASGGFVVVWSSRGQDDPGYGYGLGVFAKRFDAAAAAVGTEFQVNTSTTDLQANPRVALAGASGNFIVAWDDIGGDGTDGQDGDASGVFSQRFASSAAPAGSEFQVNATTTGSQRRPAIDTLGPNEFVIVWEAPDGDYAGVFGQRFGPVTP